MTSSESLLRSYLRALEEATADLPAAVRDDVLADVRAHLEEVRHAGDDTQIRDALDRLGAPEEIAAAAREAEGVPAVRTAPVPPAPGPTVSSSARDGWTVAALLLAPAVLGLAGMLTMAWLAPFGVLAGMALAWWLLWSSRTWTGREKLLGTLVWPGGLVTPFVLMTAATSVCTEQVAVLTNGGEAIGPATVTCEGFSLPPAIGLPVAIAVWAAPLVVGGWLLHRGARRRTLVA